MERIHGCLLVCIFEVKAEQSQGANAQGRRLDFFDGKSTSCTISDVGKVSKQQVAINGDPAGYSLLVGTIFIYVRPIYESHQNALLSLFLLLHCRRQKVDRLYLERESSVVVAAYNYLCKDGDAQEIKEGFL